MSIDEETKKIARELFAEIGILYDWIKEYLSEEKPEYGAIYSYGARSTILAKRLLEKIDPDYINN